jgi:hypothetical protein
MKGEARLQAEHRLEARPMRHRGQICRRLNEAMAKGTLKLDLSVGGHSEPPPSCARGDEGDTHIGNHSQIYGTTCS